MTEANLQAFRAALEQIERLSRTADRDAVDVPAMLGDIARKALAANKNPLTESREEFLSHGRKALGIK
jgi:hypothetical protein